LALNDVELHLLSFCQGFEAFPFDRAEMAEDILLAIIARQKAEAFFIAKPLDCSTRTQCGIPL
jgi:hypothetical protein